MSKLIINETNEVLFYCGLESKIKQVKIVKKDGEEIILGKGGFGTVYKGQMMLECTLGSKKFDRIIDIAIKRIYVQSNGDAERLIELIKREINIYQTVCSPYIVQYYGQKVQLQNNSDNTEYIDLYLELCDGNLQDLILKNQIDQPLQESEGLEYLSNIIQALQLISSSDFYRSCDKIFIGACHRDIHLKNVLFQKINNKNYVKLCDFGVSQYKWRLDKQEPTEFTGTEFAMSPQNRNQKQYDLEKNDSWSLGVLLFCLLFGFRKFLQNYEKFNASNQHFQLIDQGQKISNKTKELLRGLLSYEEKERLTISQAEEKIQNHVNLNCIGSFKCFEIARFRFIQIQGIIEKLKNANFTNLNYDILKEKNLVKILNFLFCFLRDLIHIYCRNFSGSTIKVQGKSQKYQCFEQCSKLMNIFHSATNNIEEQQAEEIQFWRKYLEQEKQHKNSYSFDDIYYHQQILEDAIDIAIVTNQEDQKKQLEDLKNIIVEAFNMIYNDN